MRVRTCFTAAETIKSIEQPFCLLNSRCSQLIDLSSPACCLPGNERIAGLCLASIYVFCPRSERHLGSPGDPWSHREGVGGRVGALSWDMCTTVSGTGM